MGLLIVVLINRSFCYRLSYFLFFHHSIIVLLFFFFCAHEEVFLFGSRFWCIQFVGVFIFGFDKKQPVLFPVFTMHVSCPSFHFTGELLLVSYM